MFYQIVNSNPNKNLRKIRQEIALFIDCYFLVRYVQVFGHIGVEKILGSPKGL